MVCFEEQPVLLGSQQRLPAGLTSTQASKKQKCTRDALHLQVGCQTVLVTHVQQLLSQ